MALACVRFKLHQDLAVVHRRIVQETTFVSALAGVSNNFFLFNDLFILGHSIGQPKEPKYEILHWAYLITFKGEPNVEISGKIDYSCFL